MLTLKAISLLNFKNYTNRSFTLSERIIGIYGNNGVGKTNFLDAIHYLCFTKSYFSRTDSKNVQQGMKGFRIQGDFILDDVAEQTVCILRENDKKEFAVNGNTYTKFSQHIGRYPCVVIAPDDATLITGGSEERRKFMDALLSQIDISYLQHLIVYTKVLQQRNALLKQCAEKGIKNDSLLDILDEQLINAGDMIFKKRSAFLLNFLPVIRKEYNDISRKHELIHLQYESDLLHHNFKELLTANRTRDYMAQRTTAGIHKDDLVFEMNNQPFKTIASQGQRKSLLFALKLAEVAVISEEKKFAPLLLLDDIFEKLDEDRITNLLQKVVMENKGQVFITDTHPERLKQYLEALKVPLQSIHLTA